MAVKCPICQYENPEDSRFCNKCGTQILPFEQISISQTKTIQILERELTKGRIFAGKYRIVEEIGRGGMGVVYKAEDTKLKRTIALKFLPQDLSLHPEAKERLIREAQAAAALDHPNICTIYEVDETEEKSFISMAYVKGQSLKDRIESGPIEQEKALEISIQIAEGLKEAHKMGIVHRDIKSANIMVDEKGQVKIMDFGLAKVSGSTLITREGTTMGTLAYMSPEQTRGEAVDHRSDIWSLGVVLYEVLSGQLPFKGDHDASILYSIVHEEHKNLKAIKPGIPAEMQQIVNRALKKKPESRYSSVDEMLEDLVKYKKILKAEEIGITDFRSLLRSIRQPRVAVPLILTILALCVIVVWLLKRSAKIRWAKNEAIPEINRLLERDDFTAAFRMALRVEKYIPKNPQFVELMPRIERTISVETDPTQADIYIKDYKAIDSDWEFLGQSPIDSTRVSRAFKRWKIAKQGFETIEGTEKPDPSGRAGGVSDINIDLKLDEEGSISPGMVRVKGGNYAPKITAINGLKRVRLKEYLIDKYEVSNKQYKEFMENGGYRKKEYWKHKFTKDGRVFSWEEAMKEFVDATGRPGPSTWELGNPLEGQDDYPVTGISWYEAAAYAEFAGKSLPTVYHWNKATGMEGYGGIVRHIIPLSNFAGKSIAPVGSYQGLSPYGAYDMAGNVREWCWNEEENKRIILGGSWNESQYVFYQIAEGSSPFYRAENLGFRCMKYLHEMEKEAAGPVPTSPGRDWSKEKPCSDELFDAYKLHYVYEKTELDPVIESRDDTPKHWIREKVTFNAAYGNERMIAYLFIPKHATPSFQTIVIFPPIPAHIFSSIDDFPLWREEEFIRSGRAVLFPVYKGTFERPSDFSTAIKYNNHIIMWSKDLGRAIDYLETRPEFDPDKIGYFGVSWGASLGAILPAIETRIKVVLIVSGGLQGYTRHINHPETSQINFAPRITAPVLYLSGGYEDDFSRNKNTDVLFRLFGTPEKDKEHRFLETGHFVWSSNEYLKVVFDWLDKYLGPVK